MEIIMEDINEKRKACIYIDVEDMTQIKNIVSKRGGGSVAHVYNDFLISVISCRKTITMKKDKSDGSKKKQFAMIVNADMANAIDTKFHNCVNYSKSFAGYAKDFIECNKDKSLWERLTYPDLKAIYVRPNKN